ncbi:hypothetical protein SAMN05421805_12156 [Saccharopolyspora antimicrobica]|uniref:histidine kinase n=1 Tax=Saccharopolyspora antimicrobica TaxID=455193 RepID=A0A1I5J4K2_9PSEU|nr:hypothetical protein [Saccharopolyspora antimicrobica]SFO67652.1 hypothetical protein SAMN05421805_12156 [Saccharopolyspora antimicrobica]
MQEALTNVVKHARAESVAVELGSEEDALLIAITDDGRERPRAADGRGLIGNRQRPRVCGGTTSLDPAVSGRGTARLPVVVA